jgi:hypothetical protein
MADNRPRVGYIIWSFEWGQLSWSNQERRLYSSESCQVFPTRRLAKLAINRTVEYAISHGYKHPGWKAKDYLVCKCVTARRLVI